MNNIYKELNEKEMSKVVGGKCSLKDGLIDATSAGMIGAIGGPWGAIIGAGAAGAACAISNMK